jgi:hypothetical protein
MRTILFALLLATLCLLASWSFSAQVIDGTTCEQGCYQRESVCVEACGTHEDPMECEGRCHDQREDCVEDCGRS